MTNQMDAETLRLAHDEIWRLRDAQSIRISSVRARSAGILGAAGVSASIVTALASNPWFLLSLVAYAFSVAYAVKSMSLKPFKALHPLDVLGASAGRSPYRARAAMVRDLVQEYDRSELALAGVVKSTRAAMGWFLSGTFATVFVSLVFAIIALQGRG